MEVPVSRFAIFCVLGEKENGEKKERERGKGIRGVSVVSEQHQIKSVPVGRRNVIGTEGIEGLEGDQKKHLHHHHHHYSLDHSRPPAGIA